MNILPYTIANTNDVLTGRGGLLCVAELMRQIGFSFWVERYFPKPGSNRGYRPAEVVTLWMLMLHEGARCLEDVRHLREDKALRTLLGLRRLPSADMLGDWLRRLGEDEVGIDPGNHLIAVAEMLSEGSEILFCRRDGNTAREDMLRMLTDIKGRISATPKGAVYYSCTGRGRYQFGDNSEELKLIRAELGDLPLVGFFANGEIFHNRLYGHTGVLTVFF